MSEQSLCEIAEVTSTKKPLSGLDKIFVRAFSVVIVSMSMLMTLIIAGAAAARYIFKSNFYGYEEIAVLVAFWLYFIGASYGSWNNTHVSADVVDAYFKDGPAKRALVVARNAVALVVCGLFTWYSFSFFEFGFMGPLGTGEFRPTSMVWRIPLYTSYGAITLGLVFMEAYFLRDFIKAAKALASWPRESEKRERAAEGGQA